MDIRSAETCVNEPANNAFCATIQNVAISTSATAALAHPRRRQRTARNLAAQRGTGVLLEQLRQLLAHAIRHAVFDWRHGASIAALEKLLDRSHKRRFTLRPGGRPRQLSDSIQTRCTAAC